MAPRKDDSPSSIDVELERLRGRVTELEQSLAEAEQSTQGLRHDQMLLRGLVENMPAVVFIRDMQWRFILVNKHLEAVVNMAREQLLGKPDHEACVEPPPLPRKRWARCKRFTRTWR